MSEIISSIFFAFGQFIKQFDTTKEYLIDSFPVAVCKNIRIKRCKLLQGEAYRGYNSSKREYFYVPIVIGIKVQIITTQNGIPVEFFIGAGSYHDITAFKNMNIDLPKQSSSLADSAYTDYELEDYYRDIEQIYLEVDRKSNSKRVASPAQRFYKKFICKRIETTFSQITGFFPRTIHTVTVQGFSLKIVLFIFAFTL